LQGFYKIVETGTHDNIGARRRLLGAMPSLGYLRQLVTNRKT